jgi:hypothetical protein
MDRRRIKDRRRSGPSPQFPIPDSEGQTVTRDRRMIATRRLSDYNLDVLWRKLSIVGQR